MRAAGVVFLEPDGKMLFVRRSGSGDHAGEWALPGGGIERGEDAETAAARECGEELGYVPDSAMIPLIRTTSDEGVDYTTFVNAVDDQFEPRLNDEHTDFIWATADDPPEPLHPALQPALRVLSTTLAQDDFDPGEPRDESGEWASGGAGSKGKGKKGRTPQDSIREFDHAREYDLIKPAVRDPSTGKIYTGFDHEGARAAMMAGSSTDSDKGEAGFRINGMFWPRDKVEAHIAAGGSFGVAQDEFSPSEPRDESGEWTDGGGGSKEGAAEYKRIVGGRRSAEGVVPAIRDPLTGKVYTGGNWVGNSIPYIHRDVYTDLPPDVKKRVKDWEGYHSKTSGFVDEDGKFWTRDEVEAALKIGAESYNLAQTMKEGGIGLAALMKAHSSDPVAAFHATDAYNPSEPREDDGKWTSGGSGGGGGGEKAGESSAPGNAPEAKAAPPVRMHGYSAEATLDSNGVIHTSNVMDAVRAMYEKRKVELNQPREISTMLDHLDKVAKHMAVLGKNAPNFDLCLVSVHNTNLFCAQNKGISRIDMPQIPPEKNAAFEQYLTSKGVKVEDAMEDPAYLRATQRELIGAKVAGIMESMKATGLKLDPKTDSLFVSRDNYIVDGHHRWAAEIGLDTSGHHIKIPVRRVDMPILDLLKATDEFTKGAGHVGVGATDAKPRDYWSDIVPDIGHCVACDDFNPSEPRDKTGEWTSGGVGGANTGVASAPKPKRAIRTSKPKEDPASPAASSSEAISATIAPPKPTGSEITQPIEKALPIKDPHGVWKGEPGNNGSTLWKREDFADSPEWSTRVFHGTYAGAIQSILDKGIVPGQGKGGDDWWLAKGGSAQDMYMDDPDRKGSVYITDSQGMAGSFADLVSGFNKDKSVILAVQIPRAELQNVVSDEAGGPGGHAFRFRGAIKPEWIRAMAVPKGKHFGKGAVGQMKVNSDAADSGDLVLYLVPLTEQGMSTRKASTAVTRVQE